jgi:nitroreductase/NAD-dependent dihydropyrimidine dehydrogenase PreA subunit
MVTIDNEKCTMCGKCAAVCPAVVIEEKDGRMECVYSDSCISCWHCVAVCPSDAVSCDEFPLEAFEIIPKTKTPDYGAVRELLTRRRSVREFKDKEIPRETLEELIRVAAQSPTGHNAQSVKLTVVTNRELIDSLDTRILKNFNRMGGLLSNKAAKGLIRAFAGKGMAEDAASMKTTTARFLALEGHGRLHIFRGAPVLIVAHAGPDALTGKDDCVAALANLSVAANTMGLGATWIGYLVGAAMLDHSLKKPLGIPAKNMLHSAIILGWPRYQYRRTIPRKAAEVKWIPDCR